MKRSSNDLYYYVDMSAEDKAREEALERAALEQVTCPKCGDGASRIAYLASGEGWHLYWGCLNTDCVYRGEDILDIGWPFAEDMSATPQEMMAIGYHVIT